MLQVEYNLNSSEHFGSKSLEYPVVFYYLTGLYEANFVPDLKLVLKTIITEPHEVPNKIQQNILGFLSRNFQNYSSYIQPEAHLPDSVGLNVVSN